MKPYLIITIFYLLTGCDFFSMDRIPSEPYIKNGFAEFLVDDPLINGIYSNMDVDSVVFQYKTSNQNAISNISEKLASENWSIVIKENDELVVTRKRKPCKGELNFYSFELAKVALENGYICVGYVQADTKSEVNSLYGDEAGEIKWAVKHIWPRYNSCVNSHNNSHHSQP